MKRQNRQFTKFISLLKFQDYSWSQYLSDRTLCDHEAGIVGKKELWAVFSIKFEKNWSKRVSIPTWLWKVGWIFWAESWIFWSSDFQHAQATLRS